MNERRKILEMGEGGGGGGGVERVYLVRVPLQIQGRSAQQVGVAVPAQGEHSDCSFFHQIARFFFLGKAGHV